MVFRTATENSGRDQPPQTSVYRPMGGDGVHNGVNDEFDNPQQDDRQKRREQTGNQAKHHYRGAGVPNDLENRRHVAERCDTLVPPGPETFPCRQRWAPATLIDGVVFARRVSADAPESGPASVATLASTAKMPKTANGFVERTLHGPSRAVEMAT